MQVRCKEVRVGCRHAGYRRAGLAEALRVTVPRDLLEGVHDPRAGAVGTVGIDRMDAPGAHRADSRPARA